MKTIYRISALITTLALLLLSCTKEDNNLPNEKTVSFLKGKLEASAPATKTQHEYLDKTLKVSWSRGDEIAVSDGKRLYKFTQTGELGDNGHTSMFASENPVTFGSEEIIAVYPYTADLAYDLTSQTGTLDKLFQTDLLLARAQVSATSVGDLEFNPLCAVMRFPKGILVTDEDFSGEVKISVYGDNICNKIIVSKAGSIDVQLGEITFKATVSEGKLSNDIYFSLIPKSSTGSFSYSIITDREDYYCFTIDNITTSKLYTIKSVFNNFVSFEDSNFKKRCVGICDKNGDGEVSYNEAEQCKSLYIFTTPGLFSLKGLKAFRNITEFQIDNAQNPLISNLEQLNFNFNHKLKKISVCNIKTLKELEVSGCPELEILNCWDNRLTQLDVSQNPNLKHLSCGINQISSLDLSNNIILDYLWCNQNKLTNLDLSSNNMLTELGCSENELTELDLSGCSELNYLNCNDNKLAALNLSNNTKLATLRCYNNQLPQLDLNNNTKLITLYCYNNQLSSLNIQGCVELNDLQCYMNSLAHLDLSDNSKLTKLYCYNNQITSLDLKNCTVLSELACGGNQLTTLDMSKNTSLLQLSCGANQLTKLDVRGCSSLTKLWCNDNRISQLLIGNNTSLSWLYCNNNELAQVDISGCPALENYICNDNIFTTLDLSNHTSLINLTCSDNKLTQLILNGCSGINDLRCHNNQLSQLDVKDCTQLWYLRCDNNNLTQLDVSKNLYLEQLIAWAQTGTLSQLMKKAGQTIIYKNSNKETIDPATYGTTIVEVE